MSTYSVKTAQQYYARLAGFMFLFYIAIGIASMVMFSQATSGAEGTAAKLEHANGESPMDRRVVRRKGDALVETYTHAAPGRPR